MKYIDHQLSAKCDSAFSSMLVNLKDYIEIQMRRRVALEVQRHLDAYFDRFETKSMYQSQNLRVDFQKRRQSDMIGNSAARGKTILDLGSASRNTPTHHEYSKQGRELSTSSISKFD